MSVSPANLMRQWFEGAWNQGRTELIETYMAADAVAHGLDETGARVSGPAGFRAFFEKIRSAFSDIRFELHDVIEAGDLAVARWSARMNHTGDGLGIAPTQRPVTFTGMTIVRVKDGQVTEGWNEWDRLTLLSEIGVVTLPPPPG